MPFKMHYTPIPDDINALEDDTAFEHVLVESRMSVQLTRYLLIIFTVEDGIEHGTVDTSVVTSSKPSEMQIVLMWLLLIFF